MLLRVFTALDSKARSSRLLPFHEELAGSGRQLARARMMFLAWAKRGLLFLDYKGLFFYR